MTSRQENRKAVLYKAGLYMRLSKDDDGTKESASISTQRKMLRSYAGENGFLIYEEYVDDGFSGTNFDRPAWKQLLADIEAGQVNLVITKDLSRLGRDYIMTGQFTEIYFPSKKVRYIAVNDGYDSDSPWSDIAPFKNIMNEMYARDISKKIRSAFQTKRKEGAFIGNFAPYGYQKDPDNKNHLLIDPMTAPVVREIFERAGKGAAPSQIAKALNQKGVLTPAMSRLARRSYGKPEEYSKRKEWTSGTICKMLKNPVYLGHVVQGKTVKASFKSPVTLQKPKEEWMIVKDMHEPLISPEVFERARKRSISRRCVPGTGFSNIFSGLARCGDCDRNMSTTGAGRNGKGRKLVCGGYKLYGKRECTNHYMDYELLYKVIVQEIGRFLSFTEEEKRKITRELAESYDSMEMIKERKEEVLLEKREEEITCILKQLYEDRIKERIGEEGFYRMLNSYEKEQKEVASRLVSIQESHNPVNKGEPKGEDLLTGLIKEVKTDKELSPDLLYKFIERIEIYQAESDSGKGGKYQTIRIYYKTALA